MPTNNTEQYSEHIKYGIDGCPYSALTSGKVDDRLTTVENRRLLLDYLLKELQAARICAVKQPQTLATTSVIKLSDPLAEPAELLKRTLKSLELSKLLNDVTTTQLFEQLSSKVKEQLSHLPKDHLGKALFIGSLHMEQWAALERLNGELLIEYDVRAQLLLKRLDVTIQSFSWSERIKDMEAEMLKIYRPLRNKLHSTPTVSVSDLLAARNDLSLVVKMSDESVRTMSKINKVMLGAIVPDRGGRPADIQRQPSKMPAWQKERAAAPAGRGGYRGGGGGGGGSGRIQRGGGGRGRHGGGGGGGGYGQHGQQGQAQYMYEEQGSGFGRQAGYEAPSYGGYAGQQEFYEQGGGHSGGGGGGGRGHSNKRGRRH
uniref:Protein FAM98A n=1 Tax=Plectus sambesii TaxID=2011161 RepID=A0A914XHS0_9BILA